MTQFFKILIFSQDIWRKVHYVREINLISEGTMIKTFLFSKQIPSTHDFVGERQLKTIMRK